MTSRMSSGGAWLIAIIFMSISTASAKTPVGVLGAHSKVRIAAAESSVVLRDQASFSNDNVQTPEGARAAVQLNNDLRVTFTGTAENNDDKRGAGPGVRRDDFSSAWAFG